MEDKKGDRGIGALKEISERRITYYDDREQTTQ